MEKVGQFSAVVAAATGVIALILYVSLEHERICEWVMFDIFRKGATTDATVLVAKLRNDREGRYTEDLLQWIKKEGFQYFELGRSWKEVEEADEALFDREEALNKQQFPVEDAVTPVVG